MNKENTFSAQLASFTNGKLYDKSSKLVLLIAEASKEFENDEYKVIDFVFSYLQHNNPSVSENILDGAAIVTNKHIFIFDLETSTKLSYSLTDTKAEIVNAQNLFNEGVTRRLNVSEKHDPYISISNAQHNISCWILDLRGSVTNSVSVPGFAADNYYYGLYLVLQSLKNNKDQLKEAKEIFYYRRNSQEFLIIVLPLIMFIITFSTGIIFSLISGDLQYFPISLMIGILVISISLFIGIPYLIISKKIFDTSLLRKARKTFSVNSDKSL